jgi:hypothetical protein
MVVFTLLPQREMYHIKIDKMAAPMRHEKPHQMYVYYVIFPLLSRKSIHVATE